MSVTSPRKLRPRLSSIAETTTTVKVGEKSYRIHRGFLTHYSEYFRAALNGSFKEAEENLVTLSDVSISTFDVFVDWLYTQKLPEQGEYLTLDEAVGHWLRLYGDGTRNKTEGLIDLYIFADGHDIPKLRREVMDVLFPHLNSECTAVDRRTNSSKEE